MITEFKINGDLLRIETKNNEVTEYFNGMLNAKYALTIDEEELHIHWRQVAVENDGDLTENSTDLSNKL